MKRQALVIGLGQFGMAVSRALSRQDTEVFAVDKDEAKVREAAEFAADAVMLDAMDEDALTRISPDRRDFCLCAIGDDARDASIICTALLAQLGAKRIIARANNALHARILTSIGAHLVVNPEREYGDRFANRLVHDSIHAEMPLGDGLWVTEFEVPEAFIGKPLSELALPRRFGIFVVAIRHADSGSVSLPEAGSEPQHGDVFVVVAREGVVAKLMERT